jgi:hypothetical protein
VRVTARVRYRAERFQRRGSGVSMVLNVNVVDLPRWLRHWTSPWCDIEQVSVYSHDTLLARYELVQRHRRGPWEWRQTRLGSLEVDLNPGLGSD